MSDIIKAHTCTERYDVDPTGISVKVSAQYPGISVRVKSSRDALLPRLISGKLSVENLDIQFPPSMEETAHAV